MKALVTGAGGFVGRHLVPALREAGWRVITSARSGPADLPGDLLRIPLRGVTADVVFHLAGFSTPSASIDEPEATYEGNAAATARVVQEVRAGRFIVASTGHVYGPQKRRTTESTPVSPRSPYAASKLCAEALAPGLGRDVVVLRAYNHTGPGQSKSYVCPWIAGQIARAEAGGRRVVEVRATAPRLDLFDVRDMAQAYLLAAEKGLAGEIYNVGTGSPVSVQDVLELLVAESRVPVRVHSKPGRVDLMSGDSSKFRGATGWRPRITLSKTLSDLLDFEREQTRRI